MERYSSAFRKVGFFRFVSNYEHPVAELSGCLSAAGGSERLRQSLIVLPEAFNIRKNYSESGDCDYKRGILSDLTRLAGTLQVTFVARLIIEDCVLERLRRKRPYSSAHFSDARRPVLMCRKVNDDRSNDYAACDEHDVVDRPIALGDTCLVALICRDCNNEKAHDISRNQELKDRIARTQKAHNIVCIPAHMSGKSGFRAEGIASSWPTSDVLLANSHPRPTECESFISIGDIIKPQSAVGDRNQVIRTLPDSAGFQETSHRLRVALGPPVKG